MSFTMQPDFPVFRPRSVPDSQVPLLPAALNFKPSTPSQSFPAINRLLSPVSRLQSYMPGSGG